MNPAVQPPFVALKGGEFLLRHTPAELVFTPEDFSEEQRMVAQAAQDFLRQEVFSRLDEIDSQADPTLMPRLLDLAGELGLLSTSIPEAYGGSGMDFITTMLLTEVIGAAHSFAVAQGAHTGIGTLPILYYGNEAQKQKYIPKLATGEWKAAYCLTEPDAGSDANSGKTKARLNAEGTHYLLTGQKMWITNGGFADVFTVFAKMDDDPNLSAFIVERGFGGITMNAEEHKMGIKGSSTRQIFFNDCPVPVENLLSTRGNGFKIAVNILNIGRIKLAVAAIGAAKEVLTHARRYASERKQFGQTLNHFGAIRAKLAEMEARIYASEAACYRASQNIDDAINHLKSEGLDEAQARLKGVEQFAIECALLKVQASEALDFVVDEGVQIYGGMGYSADAPMERSYRDARINRIFEGTNEINRMLAVGTVLKRALKGELDLLKPALAVSQELLALPDMNSEDSQDPLAAERKLVQGLKKTFLLLGGAAAQKLGASLDQQQEVLMALADILIETYTAESTLLRCEKKALRQGWEAVTHEKALVQLTLHRAASLAAQQGRELATFLSQGDEARLLALGVKRFTKYEVNALALRQRVGLPQS